jgi:hypothetical protein
MTTTAPDHVGAGPNERSGTVGLPTFRGCAML